MDTNQVFDRVALLREAFKGLEENELQEIAARTELRSYPADHVLCQEDAFEDLFYVIADGSVEISKKISDEAGSRVIRIGGRGDLVGEMALIQDAPRSATVRTLSPCRALVMEKLDFESMLRNSPRMAMDIVRITLDRMRANDQLAIEDLQKTNKLLRQLDRNKLEFIQVAAHELRTPLTVLKGYVDVLKSFPALQGDEALEQVLAGIGSGAGRMHEIVNMMLDVTRFDTREVVLQPTTVALKGVIDKVVLTFAEAAKERRITVNVMLTRGTPNIQGDPDMIFKALYHLVVNAIKYTPDGGRVEVRTTATRMENGAPGVEIAVADSGIGLDEEHHRLVFEKFYQVGSVDIHASGKTMFKGGGPGLGLAIVSGVARMHGGRVWVESPGCDEARCPGSTFHLQLPIQPPVKL